MESCILSCCREITADRFVLDIDDLQQLFDVLRKLNYSLIGPTVRERAIVYENVSSVENLPVGWTDGQGQGTYRLKKTGDERAFGYTPSPQSWKRFLFPPAARLLRANRSAKSIQAVGEEPPNGNYAFIGVRSCEIHAIATQDRVFLKGQYSDPEYRSRARTRSLLRLIVAMQEPTASAVPCRLAPRRRSVTTSP